jgi:hypothetical protein
MRGKAIDAKALEHFLSGRACEIRADKKTVDTVGLQRSSELDRMARAPREHWRELVCHHRDPDPSRFGLGFHATNREFSSAAGEIV